MSATRASSRSSRAAPACSNSAMATREAKAPATRRMGAAAADVHASSVAAAQVETPPQPRRPAAAAAARASGLGLSFGGMSRPSRVRQGEKKRGKLSGTGSGVDGAQIDIAEGGACCGQEHGMQLKGEGWLR